MEDPRIISTQFNSPKMPYYNVLVNTLQTISPKYPHKLFPAAYLLFKFLLPYLFQVFPCPGTGMYRFFSGFMALYA